MRSGHCQGTLFMNFTFSHVLNTQQSLKIAQRVPGAFVSLNTFVPSPLRNSPQILGEQWGANGCGRKKITGGHAQAQVQVNDGGGFFANAFTLLFIKLFSVVSPYLASAE